MKKLCLVLLSFVITIVSTIAILCCFNTMSNNTNSLVNAEEKDRYSIFTKPGLATVSQEGKVFDSYDSFYKNTTFYDLVEYPTIYTNKTITISITHKFLGLDSYNIYYYTQDKPAGIRIGSNSQGVNPDFYREYVNNERNIPCYVFDYGNAKINEPVLIKLSFLIDNNIYYLDFVLVQTNNNFSLDNNLKWEYTYNNQKETIKSPTDNKTYPPISLFVPNGTELNPTYVKFTYLGDEFTIYNINGEFYNLYDNSKLNIDCILFNLSGTYTVEIYDRTKFCYQNSNHYQHNFLIKNTATKYDSFYIYAHNENGQLVASNQITNANVVVDFVNMSDIYNNIDRIIVTKTWRPSGGENVSEINEYLSTTNIPSSLTFSDDGTYNIRVIDKNGGNIIKEYDFVVLKSIRSYFEMGTQIYEIGPEDPVNTYKTFKIDTTIYSSYNQIAGKTDYSFNVTVAKSSPSISGINNNGRKQGSVNLTIYGVGKIQVNISLDGKQSPTQIVSNGQKLEKLDTPGKYHIKITDEMGTTITKSFTITVKMNSAAKAIIIIGIIIAAIFVVVVIITRVKVKVR